LEKGTKHYPFKFITAGLGHKYTGCQTSGFFLLSEQRGGVNAVKDHCEARKYCQLLPWIIC